MTLIRSFLAASLLLSGMSSQARAASVYNCTSEDIRVVAHHHASAPNAGRTKLIGRNKGITMNFDPGVMLKVYEVSLFDVLRASTSDLSDNSTYVVSQTADGRWTILPRVRC